MSNKIVVIIEQDIEELIPGFLKNREKDIVILTEAINNGDFETIQNRGHRIKGASATYGFKELSEIGKNIEIAAKKGQVDIIEEMIQAFKLYLQSIEIQYE